MELTGVRLVDYGWSCDRMVPRVGWAECGGTRHSSTWDVNKIINVKLIEVNDAGV